MYYLVVNVSPKTFGYNTRLNLSEKREGLGKRPIKRLVKPQVRFF